MKLKFVKETGTLADCLGVSDEKMAEMDLYVNELILQGNSIRQIFEKVQDQFDTSLEEITAFAYAFGYYIAKNGY